MCVKQIANKAASIPLSLSNPLTNSEYRVIIYSKKPKKQNRNKQNKTKQNNMTTIALTILSTLSAIPILIICASLYFTHKRMDKMTNTMKELYSNVQFHDMIINYTIADDIREIREQLEDYKSKLKSKSKSKSKSNSNSNKKSYTEKDANDPKSQAN